MLNAVPSWFAVLPDHSSATEIISTVRAYATREISHPSGRPWLLGRWDEGTATTGAAGDTGIAVLGQHAATADQLTRTAGRAHTVADLDRLAGSLAGSIHLVASVAGQVRVQGSASGLRRVFHARVGGVEVAADRADVLAALLDAAVDEQRLALHLLEPCPPYLLGAVPVWRAVSLVPVGHYVVLNGTSAARSVKWWSPTEPVIPIAEGATAYRAALSAAVDARLRRRELVSCDLSGLDSTSLCCLAAGGRAKVVAYTSVGRSHVNEDARWATRTLAELDTVEHHLIPPDQLPLMYQGMLNLDEPLEHPCFIAVEYNRGLLIPRQAAARGSRLHFAGYGGDDLLTGSPAYLHSMSRTHPVLARRYIRGFAAKYRWSKAQLRRQLLDIRGYRAWLADLADHLSAPPDSMHTPTLTWERSPRLRPWVTPAAAAAVRDSIRATARHAEALAPKRGPHFELQSLSTMTGIMRQYAQLVGRLGITLAMPYYDDRVIEAALAVRPQDRIVPWEYKPLIKAAMRGIVPDQTLTRKTKDAATSDVQDGERRHRGDLLAVWEDSRLARLGLIDAKALHKLCRGPLPEELGPDPLRQTLACEVWLRSLERAPVAAELMEG